ncbi:MAG: hypothetical protein ACO273_03085 [Burkholderiales bacterium]
MVAAAWHFSLEVRWPWRRLLPALMVSALVHYLIVDGWRPSGGAPQFPVVMPQLQAQLELPAVLMAATETAVAENPPLLPEAVPEPARNRITQKLPAVVSATDIRPAESPGAAVPDLRIYPARELDRFPVPLMPLDLRTGLGSVGVVRFWVSIDITGYAVEAEVITGDLPAALAASARDLLLAARFSPGFKNERPVKSRILLELRYGP